MDRKGYMSSPIVVSPLFYGGGIPGRFLLLLSVDPSVRRLLTTWQYEVVGHASVPGGRHALYYSVS